MMVLGPKHVGEFLIFSCLSFIKLYICAVVGVMIEFTVNERRVRVTFNAIYYVPVFN